METAVPPSTIKVDATKKKKNKYVGLYMSSLITRRITLPIKAIGRNIKETIEKVIVKTIEGKCTVEGFIKPNSTKILTYSSGLINGNNIVFEVVFECLVCSPVEGMHIKCIAKNITQAGIRALADEQVSPVVVYVSRDHHHTNPYFASIKDDEEINVRVIGQRFELNDEFVSIIGELIEPKVDKERFKKKPKLILKPN